MAGHSKWANIKHRKAAQDAKRGKIFTKLIRELVVASKAGGPNPDDNPTLRTAMDKALTANMRRDTIDKAVARGAGANDDNSYEAVTYEGYGVAGVAIFIECLTDNRNRTVADVRHAFSKRGGNLGTDGSVSYLFTRLGQISYPAGVDEELLLDAALNAGADDVVTNIDGSVDVLTSFVDYLSIKDALVGAGFQPDASEIIMTASTSVSLDVDAAIKVLAMIDILEDLDDVQNVYTNADISDEVIAQMQ